MKNRPMIKSPGKSPLNSDVIAHVPITGTDRMMPEAIRRPVPDSASSGNE